ncbi:striatin-interacting protein 1-like [Dendronephthya gigantea]|uniref:striatin-interacting protein 1-like n=1 Tax=Dendronephthya gigantea TaxID=151771 RepID=UPI00106B79D6|nr:striatin-interacting protein 1-like [Dendronephthya gigantea]
MEVRLVGEGSMSADKKNIRGIPKLRELLKRQKGEADNALDGVPDVEFTYSDAQSIQDEIAELYSYTEEEEFKRNKEAFHCEFPSVKRWNELSENEKKSCLNQLIDKIDSIDDSVRVPAVLSLLYLAQGAFEAGMSEDALLKQSRENVFLLYSCGILHHIIQLLNLESENPNSAIIIMQKPSISIADSDQLRLYLNILYIMVETMRYDDPTDSELMMEQRETFIFELSQPVHDECLHIVLFEMVVRFCAGNCPYFPIKKILLLLWKTILVTLGGTNDIDRVKRQSRLDAGLPEAFDEGITDKNGETSHSNMTSSENANDEIDDLDDNEFKATRKPRPRPKVRQKDIDLFLDATRSKFVGYQITGDDSTLAGLPHPIHEGLHVMKKHIYTSLGEYQLKAEEDALERPFTAKKFQSKNEVCESLYKSLLPNMPQYMISLLKILLASSPTAKAKTDSINVLVDVLPEEMPTTVLDSMRLGIDVNRHKEIIVKAISGLILLLLKHFKNNHIYQFEFISQNLVCGNCIPLILKFLNQNISSYISTKNFIPQLDFPACALNEKAEVTAESLENNGSEMCCWRNMFSCINLLRILQKLTKWKHSRTMMLIVFKSAPILKRSLKVKHEMMELYVLKLLKAQTKYLGRNWRKSNMKTMSAVYQKVRHRLNDDWAFGNDMDPRPFDLQAEEGSLKSCIDHFNNTHYGAHTNGDEMMSECDVNIHSVLDSPVDLSDDFKNAYEKWLEREVFSAPIEWEQLCSCSSKTDCNIDWSLCQ